jgi:hypothetical protein
MSICFHFENLTKPINTIFWKKDDFYLKVIQTLNIAAIVLKIITKLPDVIRLKILTSCVKRQRTSYFKIISIEVQTYDIRTKFKMLCNTGYFEVSSLRRHIRHTLDVISLTKEFTCT